jgi:peptidoglycan glycosyltransferase
MDQVLGHQQEGNDVTTTLDLNAQKVALQQLAGRKGSVVAMEPDTGKVRVMASVPGFDANDLRNPKTFAKLNQAAGSPLFNRSTQASYPPGSTFKVVTAAAALDTGQYTPDSIINGDSPLKVSGVDLANDDHESYGDITLSTALTHSVNTAFAQIGEDLGKATMAKYMKRFGFYKKPPLDYPTDQMLASGEYGRRGRLLPTVSPQIDVGRMAIGQDKLQVTPLQMAEVAATVANHGVRVAPRLTDKVVDPDGRVVQRIEPKEEARVMSEKSARELGEMMQNVVREGTGTAAALEGVDVAGKTGTAQKNIQTGLVQPWFIAYAPANDPKIAIAVTVEDSIGGFGGTVAAPIAKNVLEALLGPKAAG